MATTTNRIINAATELKIALNEVETWRDELVKLLKENEETQAPRTELIDNLLYYYDDYSYAAVNYDDSFNELREAVRNVEKTIDKKRNEQ